MWDTPGPLGAPTLVLLHGVTLDAATNWSGAVPTLAQHFRVLAMDLRGHGGPPARVPYRLEDCADDVAAVVRALGTGPVIMAGYSMGGMIAQVFWRRHPELTAGLVLCATARNVSGSFLEQLTAMTMPFVVGALGWILPVFPLSADLVGSRLLGDTLDPRVRRAVLARMRHPAGHRARGHAGGLRLQLAPLDRRRRRAFSAVLVTRQDQVVPPSRQMHLARALPGAEVVEVDGNHDVFLDAPGAFDALTAACASPPPPCRAGRTAPNRRAEARRRYRCASSQRLRVHVWRAVPVPSGEGGAGAGCGVAAGRHCPRRRTDRVEDLVAWLVTTLGLLAVLGSLLVGHAAHQAALGRASAPARYGRCCSPTPRPLRRPTSGCPRLGSAHPWPGRAPTVPGTSPR